LTKSVFENYKRQGGGKFIFLSSVKAAADSVEGILDEKASPYPKTPYGQSKLKAENFLLHQAGGCDISVYILRPCLIYGNGNKGNMALLHKLAKKGLPWPLASFHNERSFLFIDNLAFVIKEIIDYDISPGLYNISDDEWLSTNELIRIMSQLAGKKAKLIYVPKFLINALAKAGDYLNLPLDSERLQKLTENYRVANNKIKESIAKGLPYSTRQGLIRTFRDTSIIK
jgi:nucleoside-diphosphate-sugar epimerase